jgi:hypothetical protein
MALVNTGADLGRSRRGGERQTPAGVGPILPATPVTLRLPIIICFWAGCLVASIGLRIKYLTLCPDRGFLGNPGQGSRSGFSAARRPVEGSLSSSLLIPVWREMKAHDCPRARSVAILEASTTTLGRPRQKRLERSRLGVYWMAARNPKWEFRSKRGGP